MTQLRSAPEYDNSQSLTTTDRASRTLIGVCSDVNDCARWPKKCEMRR